MIASVVTGSISEMARTNVVLPAPNPPAMTIFVEIAEGDRLAERPRLPADCL
jgi:hypothetical protein